MIELAAKSNATVVILMGMSKLNAIVELFKKEGKADTPVGIIQNGTTPSEKIAIATVSTIEEEVALLGLSNPEIIVIGEVVRHREIMLQASQKYSVKELV